MYTLYQYIKKNTIYVLYSIWNLVWPRVYVHISMVHEAERYVILLHAVTRALLDALAL